MPAAEPELTRYLVVSGALLGALFLASFLVRRLAGGSRLTLNARRGIQVLEATSLGGSKRAMVVRCHDRTFLLGVGDKEVCSIAELDSDVVKVDQGKREPKTQNFAGLLGSKAPKAKARPEQTQPEPASLGSEADSPESQARRKVARELLDQLAERDLQPAPREAKRRARLTPAPEPESEPRRISELLDGRGIVG